MAKDKARLRAVSVSLPFGIGKLEWDSDPTERRAAWSLYVELVTRVAVQPLGDEEGLLREAFSSLYQLFPTTRAVLKEAGPDVGAARASVGGIAIAVLNEGIRPLLALWHPLLLDWEALREKNMSRVDHERNWPHGVEVRRNIEDLRKKLVQYADALAVIADVHVDRQ